jgi:hypothetical protein
MRGPGYPFLIQGGTTRFAKIQLVEGLGPVAECGPTHTNTHRSVGDSRRKVQAETLADFKQIFRADFSGLRRRGFTGGVACHQIGSSH